MSPVAITLLVIVIVLAIIIAVLYFLGKKAQKKQAEQQELLDANKQTVSMLIIDKKRMKLKDAGFPQIIVDNHHTSVHHHTQRCDRIPRAINHFFFFITAFLRPQTGQHLPDSGFARASKQGAAA